MGEQDQQKAVPTPPQGGASLAQAAGAAGVDVGAFDPGEHKAAEVKDVLAEATEAEKAAIAGQEQAGDNRKSVLKAAGVDEGVRLDATGREMHPWEKQPKG